MISQSLYFELQVLFIEDRSNHGVPLSEMVTKEQEAFLKPYVLIIHRPSGRGFYLNREYRHITDVSNCQEPENPVEVQRNHLCASGNLPDWALAEKCHEFTTFWLY